MNKVFGFLFLFNLGFYSQADVVAKIEEVSKDKSRVLAKLNAGVKIRQNFKLNAGKACELKLINIDGNQAILSTDSCLNLTNLIPGMGIESSFISSTENRSTMEADSSYQMPDTQFMNGFSLGIAIASHTSKSTSPYGDMTSDSNSEAVQFKASYSNLDYQSSAFFGSLTIGNKLTNEKWSKYTYLRPEFNYGFSGDKMFGYGGLNLLQFTNEESPSEVGVGFQIGGGYKIKTDKIIQFQYLSGKASEAGSELNLSGIEVGLLFLM